MTATLSSEPAAGVLRRMRAEAADRDPAAKARKAAREDEVGARIYGQEAVELYGDAHLSIAPAVGELLYVLVRATRPELVVEYGASFGFSTIYLAAAVRDAGAGRVISTELSPAKERAALENLAEAELAGHVELRGGDARQTLAGLEGEVGLLFLDGWNDLYLEILGLVEPSLSGNALVVADMSAGDPHHDRYRARLFDEGSGYRSVEVPLDEGVVLSLREDARV